MYKYYLKPLLFQIILGFVIIGCEADKASNVPEFEASEITKDIMSWLVYKERYLNDLQYSVVDTAFKKIEREEFYATLAKGNFLPLKIKTPDTIHTFQLFEIKDSIDINILNDIKQTGELQLKNFKMEGKPLPLFSFTDINNNIYDSSNSKGKLTVINCWFINCVPCVEEIPELNKLVELYENRSDIQFIALSFDPRTDIKQFLQKKPFKYAIIPEMEPYLMGVLGINGYPTHIVVDKNGKILKVLNTKSIATLKRLIERSL